MLEPAPYDVKFDHEQDHSDIHGALLTAVPKSSGGRQGCAVQPGSRLLEQEDRPDDARGQFLIVCGDVCANGGDVVLLPVEHGAHASSPVPPAGPRFNRGSPDPAGVGNVSVTRS